MSYDVKDPTYKEYLSSIDDYIQELTILQKTDPKEARRRSIESLIESGVLDEEGNTKEQICE